MSRLLASRGFVLCSLLLPSIASSQTYPARSSYLDVEGVNMGLIRNFEGGTISAPVLSRGIRSDSFPRKHIGAPKYEDFSLQIGLTRDNPIYDWIEASWNQNHVRKDGSITTLDYNFQVKSIREFSAALLTETTIPACDASSKDYGYITLKFDPAAIRETRGNAASNPPPSPLRPWISSNFRLDMEGLSTRRVTKVEAFTVTTRIINERRGGSPQIEFPNLKITLPESEVASWDRWFEEFVIEGQSSQDKEKSGSLVFLGTDMREEILRIDLDQCGIYRLADTRNENGLLLPGYVTAEIYCERLKFLR